MPGENTVQITWGWREQIRGKAVFAARAYKANSPLAAPRWMHLKEKQTWGTNLLSFVQWTGERLESFSPECGGGGCKQNDFWGTGHMTCLRLAEQLFVLWRLNFSPSLPQNLPHSYEEQNVCQKLYQSRSSYFGGLLKIKINICFFLFFFLLLGFICNAPWSSPVPCRVSFLIEWELNLFLSSSFFFNRADAQIFIMPCWFMYRQLRVTFHMPYLHSAVRRFE